MRKNKLITEALAAVLFSAVSLAPAVQTVSAGAADTVSGLIAKCSLSCNAEQGGVTITAKTQALGVMNEVGYTGIVIQRSSDGESWTDYTAVGDIISYNERFSILDSLYTEVTEGCFYRVVCSHYAKGVSFANGRDVVQTVFNTSRPVWVGSDDAVPGTEPTQSDTDAPGTEPGSSSGGRATTIPGSNKPNPGRTASQTASSTAETTSTTEVKQTAPESRSTGTNKISAAPDKAPAGGDTGRKGGEGNAPLADSPITGDTAAAVAALSAAVGVSMLTKRKRN